MPFRSRSAAVEAPEQRTIALDHPHLPEIVVRVRRNKGGRNVRIHVDEQGQVTASVPLRFAARRIDPIVRERADWLWDVLEKMRRSSTDTLVDLDRGDPTRWLGVWLPTRVERGGVRRASVRLTGEGETAAIEIRVPADEDPHDALLTWYRREARRIFELRTEAWAQSFGLAYGKVTIREQRTRWGSCTHKGDLSFNWRLVLAPAWVLDSIVVHELCHIDELNHSDRFWALLDERYPRHHEASEWLKEHGSTLRVTKPDGSEPNIGNPGTAAIGAPNWPSVGEEDDLVDPEPVPQRAEPPQARRDDEPTDEQLQMSLW